MSDEELERLARKAGLLECIDDAYLARWDWLPETRAFAELVQSAERGRCVQCLTATDLQEHNAAIAVSLQEFLYLVSGVVQLDDAEVVRNLGEEILKQLKDGPK